VDIGEPRIESAARQLMTQMIAPLSSRPMTSMPIMAMTLMLEVALAWDGPDSRSPMQAFRGVRQEHGGSIPLPADWRSGNQLSA
jgi:hypothetical protein